MSEDSRDSHFATISRVMTKAKRERVTSRDLDDASTALNKIGSENADLKREMEQLHSLHEQRERELLGMREQGPQAVKDQMLAEKMAECERLKAELESRHGNSVDCQRRIVQDISQPDPCLAVLNAYLEGQRHRGCNNQCSPDNSRPRQGVSTPAGPSHNGHQERTPNNERQNCTRDVIEEDAPACVSRRSLECCQEAMVMSAGVAAQRRRYRSLQRCLSASGVRTSNPQNSHPNEGDCNSLDSQSAQVQYRHARRHSEMSTSQVVMSAGVVAQRRRSRRCFSASSVSRRNSQGLSSFLHMLNSEVNEEGPMSWLAGLVLHLLTSEGRPIEAGILKRLLRDPTTCAQTEHFLRYTVVRDLVAKLQSPHNSAQLFRNVHPFLVESSSHFLETVKKQRPVTTRRYSCPTFF